MTEEKKRELFADLQQCGMSVAEMSVLAVLLMAPLEPAEVADVVKGELQGDALEQPLESYAQAVKSCLKKKWIRKSTKQEYKKQAALRDHETIPFVDEGIIASPGRIDLTPEGYHLFRKAAKRRYPRYGMRCNSPSFLLEIYSDSEADCREYAKSLQEPYSIYPFDDGTGEMDGSGGTVYGLFKDASEPLPIGPWRFNRFEVVPKGFRIILRYTPAPAPLA